MGFTPTFDTLDTHTSLTDEITETPTFPRIAARPTREVLRFGGLSMDPVTGAVYFRGKSVALALDERELLGILLRRAGQILSAERLAILLRTRADTLADRMDGLRETLKAAGVTCLPCRADGLGYILWRC
jgi:DNA-binding response OmpR family regulator